MRVIASNDVPDHDERPLRRPGPLAARRSWGLLLVALLAVLAGTQQAQATDSYFQQWRFRTTKVCVETHGWRFWPARDAATRWSASGAVNVFAWSDCSSQPVSQRVVLRVYDNPAEYACAKTDAGRYLDSGGYVRTMTIWLNVAPRWKAGCYATASQRAHIISHELGHALGLAHRDGPSVMASWAYQWPTASDLYQLKRRYA